jgi:ribosome-binding protein aMBF1 (putative translation factor)
MSDRKTAKRRSVTANGRELPHYSDILAEKLTDPQFAADYEAAKIETAFALELGRARDARKLSQRELGDIAGMKQPQINRYEKGRIPDIPQLRQLLKALNARFTMEPDGTINVETL